MKGKRMVYRALSVFAAIIGVILLGIAVVMELSAALVGPLGIAFGIGEWNMYDTWGTGLVNLIMHVLPGLAAAIQAVVFLIVSALLLRGATAAWRRAAVT